MTFPHSIWGWVRRLVLALGLSVGLAWSLLAQVPVSVVGEQVPLDLALTLHPVAAVVTGQVRHAAMRQGQEVQAGALLVELDSTEPQLQVAEERQKLLALDTQRTARQQEHAAAEAAWQGTEQGAQTALDEARSRHQEASTAVQTAQDKAQRFGPLALLAEQPQLKTALDTTRLTLQRLEHEQRVRLLEWRARQAQAQREIVVLDGELALTTVRLKRLEHVLEARHIRAPIAGRLRLVTHVAPGSVVHAGAWLGVIMPPGDLLVTASFPPPGPPGPLRPGQSARLRFTTGMPMAASDALPATVTQVAEAAADTDLRVVLRLGPEALHRLPLQPVVSGTVEIEVERVAPLTCLLRTLRRTAGAAWP